MTVLKERRCHDCNDGLVYQHRLDINALVETIGAKCEYNPAPEGNEVHCELNELQLLCITKFCRI